MTEAHLTSLPAGEPIDLRHLDATLANLRTAQRGVTDLSAALAEARDRIAAAPDNAEARRAVRLAELRSRADATALAEQFAALAREGAP